MKRLALLFFLLVSVLVVGLACRDSVSTAPTDTMPSASLPSVSSTVTDLDGFTCESLEEVRVRFSDPGYVRGNDVAVYAAFFGAPPGDKFLRIYWDYGNDPTEFQIVDTQAGEVRRDNDQLYDIERVVEHTYEGLSGQASKTVRVELVHEEGNTRLCGRNRDITVSSSSGRGLRHDNGLGIGERYSYTASDNTKQRARKACESHFGAGNCCIITGGYQDEQYGECGADGGPGSIHWHWDNHPSGHCPPDYVIGDVVSPGWCGTIQGSFTN